MPFQVALTSGQLETLRGTSALASHYQGAVYLSLCPNDNVYTARVNQASFAASFAQVTFDGGSGTLGDIVPGMTVLISRTNDRSKAYFTGRVRKAPTSSILYINETSASIADNDYIFLLDDHRIKDKLGRKSGDTLLMDYDTTFRQLLPVIHNLKAAYADNVDLDTDVLTIEFEPLAYAATSGATISTWAWDVGDGTITVGDVDEQDITVEFPQGFRWIYLTVTDSGGRSQTRKIPIWAHGDEFPAQLLSAGAIQVTGNVSSGYDASVTAFAGVESLLDNTLVVAWAVDELYQDDTTSLTGDNIVFIGRFRKHDDTVTSSDEAALDFQRGYTLEGPMTQLARTQQLPYEMLNDATPTAFGQIKDATIWRDIVYLLSECSTFLELHSLSFDDTSNTFLAPTRNPNGNILTAANDLAGSINASMQMNPSGSAEFVRAGWMLHYDKDAPDERDDLPTIANWTTSDLLEISMSHDHVRTVGRLTGSSGSYNSVNDAYSTYDSLAPGVAQDYPEGASSLDRQVLAANQNAANAKTEFNERAGHAFERAQEIDQISATFPDGYYSVLIPANDQWHTFTIDDDALEIHIDSSIRWLLTSVDVTHNSAEGTKEVRAQFVRETFGAPGQTIDYPAVAEVSLLDVEVLPFQPYPMFTINMDDYLGDFTPPFIGDPNLRTSEPPKDGNAVITATETQLLVVVNAIAAETPGTRDVTPADLLGTIRDGKRGQGKDFYLLSSDDTDSVIYYTEDIFAGAPIWTQTQVEGEYTALRTTDTAGELYIYGMTDCEDCACDEFFIGNGEAEAGGVFLGIVDGFYRFQSTERSSGDQAITLITSGPDVCCKYVASFPVENTENVVAFYEIQCGNPQTEESLEAAWVPDTCVNYLSCQTLSGESAPPFTFDFLFEECVGSGGSAVTRFSDDFAASFNPAREVGTEVEPFGGVDTSKVGSQVVASADGQTKKASGGSAYADYGTAHAQGAIFVPRYIFTSTSSGNAGSTPEYLLFAPALDSGEAMWRVTAGGNTFFDITPDDGSDLGLAVGHRCIEMPWRSGAIILTVADFDGVRKLATSDDSGATWNFSAALEDGALSVTTIKADATNKKAFIADGAFLGFCADYRAATPVVKKKNIGVSTDLLFVEVYS